MRRIIALNIVILIILVGGAFAGYYYFYQSANYLKTDDAKIDGQMITIASPSAGKLADWNAKEGDAFKAGDTVGSIQIPPSNSEEKGKQMDVDMPAAATIVKQSAVKDTFVGAGRPLAQAFNLDDLWVTANIDEVDIDDVEVGQSVDIYVDGYSDTTLTGKVEQIGLATASTFSILPGSNNGDSSQVIPVKISIDGYKGTRLVPGMGVTVRIDK
ncbi:HlyD family efflux transporter periplasmic adaptor subunit [Aquibacillus sp. 3ASR75-11]|uniref:HlyD family efflux transporter periplasmic adaptor subunit n=1 Tax=Terrihalobacillus insolitus TaxID=2950438 RepID=A0A9X3WZG4_9BACI|nr:HlyD family efflux transporter periplasmic adaptor subunit [Terrihalobacillus insolitus]MDC3413520.1 HlyD family efflux transporter periplasmic adaptor subunit [Terrihalobacillus insolitus]MDC3426194.1 HlyD family efflux transporter periplasmic adaptor subunit [Terrihalobacillus insolitus]